MKRYRVLITGIVIFFLAIVFSFRGPLLRSFRRYDFTKEYSRYPGVKDFLKNNPGFIDSVIDYPDILTILRKSAKNCPQYLNFFFLHQEEYIKILKHSPELRKIHLIASSSVAATEIFTKYYSESISLVINHQEMVHSIADKPEFINYLFIQHPEKYKQLVLSSDPKKTGYELYEEFIIQRYIKTNK